MAEASGADGILVFPSSVLALGGRLQPKSARVHVAPIAEATELPLILFQYPISGGLGRLVLPGIDTLTRRLPCPASAIPCLTIYRR
jgi:hypothetical protein